MLARLGLYPEVNSFATKLIQAGYTGIEAKLEIEDGRHRLNFIADMETPVGVLMALLSMVRIDLCGSEVLEYAELLLRFCDCATPGGDDA